MVGGRVGREASSVVEEELGKDRSRGHTHLDTRVEHFGKMLCDGGGIEPGPLSLWQRRGGCRSPVLCAPMCVHPCVLVAATAGPIDAGEN